MRQSKSGFIKNNCIQKMTLKTGFNCTKYIALRLKNVVAGIIIEKIDQFFSTLDKKKVLIFYNFKLRHPPSKVSLSQL